MSTDQAIQRFGNLASQTTDTQALVEATRRSFEIIEPWAHAKSSHHAVGAILGSIQLEAMRFFVSIDESIKNAQMGFQFAKSAEELCIGLSSSQADCDNATIQSYIRKMQGVAKQAHEEAITTSNMFRANRRGFNSITAKIPLALENLKSEQEEAVTSRSKAERRANGWSRACSNLISIRGNTDNNTMKSPLQLAGSLISLPVVIPVALVAQSGAMVFSAQAKDREKRFVRCEDGLQSLEPALEKLHYLMVQMDVLADYWRDMHAALEDLHERVDELRNDSLFQLNIRDLEQDWKRVRRDYMDYKTELTKLQDHTPRMRPIASSRP